MQKRHLGVTPGLLAQSPRVCLGVTWPGGRYFHPQVKFYSPKHMGLSPEIAHLLCTWSINLTYLLLGAESRIQKNEQSKPDHAVTPSFVLRHLHQLHFRIFFQPPETK